MSAGGSATSYGGGIINSVATNAAKDVGVKAAGESLLSKSLPSLITVGGQMIAGAAKGSAD